MLGRVLFIDPDREDLDALGNSLRSSGFDVSWTASIDELSGELEDLETDVAILRLTEDPKAIFELCRRMGIVRPDVRCILVGDKRDYETALEALRSGAYDYFPRPLTGEIIEPALHRALQHRGLQDEVRRLKTALHEATGFEELIGMSPPMLQLYELLERAADSNASVLITGESGTGKELVARALHSRSSRKDGAFVGINCSAIPDNLLESELFGHVKGAFTDAKIARSGLFVRATGGSIFLDEIGDMPMSLQPKLLRSLQERKVRPVGGDTEIPFDARVIAATNKNLEALVGESLFREDLFYRINVIHIEVPPLRDRATDVLLLAQHYTEHFAILSNKAVTGLSQAAAEKLMAYSWPGNVRELQNCIERAVALTRNEEIAVDDLVEKVRKYKRSHVLVVSTDPKELLSMEEVERRYIVRVLQSVGGNKREAARILGFDRKTLYRKLDKFGIEVPKSANAS